MLDRHKRTSRAFIGGRFRGHPSPGDFEILGCLRLHFVGFEGRLIPNQAAKSERYFPV